MFSRNYNSERKPQARRKNSKDNILILECDRKKITCISYFKKQNKIPEVLPCLEIIFA